MSARSVTDGPLPDDKTESEKTTIAKLLFAFSGLFERWHNDMEARRYRDPREQDPDYQRRLRELEGEIEERDFRVNNYNEGGGGKDSSWQKWILGIVSVSLVGMLSWALGKLDTLNQ